MNGSFEIIVDSAANLSNAMLQETGIKVVSFHYIVNGEEKLCFEADRSFENTAKEFYDRLAGGTDVKTSLVCEQQFADALIPALESGKDAIIVTLSSGISGTYAQAQKAANALSKRYPERKIYVGDSANASLAEGYLAYKLAKMRDGGADIESCIDWFEENKYRMNSYFTVEDLKYLKRGGRISALVAVAGSILNIKPILKANGADPAVIVVCAKERGRKKALDAILKAYRETAVDPIDKTVCIAHGNCEDEAKAFAEQFKELGADNVVLEYYDLCTGAHVGPGTIAVFFFGKDRRQPQEVGESKLRLPFLRKK